jgi:hypothetical protein
VDDGWEIKGKFTKAITLNEEIEWKRDNTGMAVVDICQVSLYLKVKFICLQFC